MALKQVLLAAVSLLALGLQAQEAAPKAASKIDKSLAVGVNLTDGNSETMMANGSLLLAGEKERLGSFKTGLEGNYGENTTRTVVDGVEAEKDEKTVSNAKLFGNVKKTVSPMTFAFLDAFVLNDDIAEIDYRATVGPGLGLYLVKNASTALSVEAGVAQVWEEVVDIEDDYLSLRFAESFEYKFAGNSKVWQSVVYLPEASDFDNYLVTAEAGIEAPLQGRLNLRVVLQDKYDSQPGADKDKNDLVLIAGVGVKL